MKPFIFLIAASVKLFSHSLGSAPVSLFGSALVPVTEVKHWAVVVQFRGDDLIYLCELTRVSNNTGGDIVGECKRMTKSEAVRGKRGIYVYDFGEVDTTPEEIKEIAENITLNGQNYNVVTRNCQYWATEFLEKLGLNTSKYTLEQVFKNMVPTFLLNLFGKNIL